MATVRAVGRGVMGVTAFVLLESVGFAQTLPHGPPATRATFLSDSSEAWDVAIDGRPVCATPCTLELSPYQFASLRSQEPNPVVLDVGRLPPGDVVVTGQPMQQGMYAGGIVATAIGGMAAVVGVTLTAIGAAKDRDGMLTAGLINLAAGGLAVAGGIWLMVAAVPTANIAQQQAGPRAAGASVGLAAAF